MTEQKSLIVRDMIERKSTITKYIIEWRSTIAREVTEQRYTIARGKCEGTKCYTTVAGLFNAKVSFFIFFLQAVIWFQVTDKIHL